MIGLCNLLITNVHVSHSYLFDPVKNEVTAFHPLLIVLPAFFARFTAPSTPLASLYDVVLYNDLCTHVCKGCQQIGKNDYYLAICSSFSRIGIIFSHMGIIFSQRSIILCEIGTIPCDVDAIFWDMPFYCLSIFIIHCAVFSVYRVIGRPISYCPISITPSVIFIISTALIWIFCLDAFFGLYIVLVYSDSPSPTICWAIWTIQSITH